MVAPRDDYTAFIDKKAQLGTLDGFEPRSLPDYLFDFQRALVLFALLKGRAALFADCGLGKTIMELVWGDAVVRHRNGRVLAATPLAVAHQTIREAERFGIEAHRSTDGRAFNSAITVTNYERLHLFDPNDFDGFIGDESSILKNYDGVRRGLITDFTRKMPYRLLATATAAPNDHIELGTTSEALGELGHMDMLGRFFKNDRNTSGTRRAWGVGGGGQPEWRFKRHAERAFWRWVASWARALRKPSDLGFDDGAFILPELIERLTVVEGGSPLERGVLFANEAASLDEQRDERRRTLRTRCETAAEKVAHDEPAVVWCHLNEEGDLLEQLISDAVQVSGNDPDEAKEEAFLAFAAGSIKKLITKPRIGGFGLNWQHCAHMTVFPSHSFEQYYQSVRRCWRFGQSRPVIVDVITSPGESRVLESQQRKQRQADRMFAELTAQMHDALQIDRTSAFTEPEALPAWL